MVTEILWEDYSEAFGFIGNSLLKAMNQTTAVGVNPRFWEAFPDFGSDTVRRAIEGCADCAAAIAKRADVEDIPLSQPAAVEFTRLFIGPPRPAAAPWQTSYRNGDMSTGFGQATFDMREELRRAGLTVCNENHQFEDHMGIELLLLAEICHRQAMAKETESAPVSHIDAYLTAYPLSWITAFREKVHKDSPCGYYDNLLALAESVMTDLDRRL